MRQKGIIILTVIILLTVPVTLCAWGFLLPACFSDTFMGELPEKVRLLDETEGRRIIVIGGSAAAFGIDSEIIRQEMEDYNVVNFGMYAGLGTKAMLDLSRKSIRRGDIVIVMPEQQEQSLTDYFGAEYFWQAADGHFSLLSGLSRDERMRAVGAFPAFAAEKFRYVSSGELPEPDGVYRKSTFVDNGDIRKGIAVENIMPGGYDRNTMIRFDAGMMSGKFAEALNAYATEMKRRGAGVYYHFSPMNVRACTFEEAANANAGSTESAKAANACAERPDPAETANSDAELIISSYTEDLAARLICPILGDPRDSVMDPEYFFDTNFHLTDKGRAIFTRQLIRDLKAELGDFTKTEGAVQEEFGISGTQDTGNAGPVGLEDSSDSPDLTDSPAPGTSSADSTSSDASFADSASAVTPFRYTIEDGIVTLTGLTGSAQESSSLTVPSEIEGCPVQVIAASTFAGQAQVRKIIIPVSVRMIEDYGFDGCTSLKEIVMENDEPDKCLVGQHLLDGTGADVIVPEDALSAYRLNYNWSVWAERIRTD